MPGYTHINNGMLFNTTDLAEMSPSEVITGNSLVNTHANDADPSTDYYDFNSICNIYLKYDRPYLITTLRFFIPFSVSSTSFKYNGITVAGTNDADHQAGTYTTLLTFGKTVVNGWNSVKIASEQGFKTIRIQHGTQSAPQTSDCRFS